MANTGDTSIGDADPESKESGIEDEARVRESKTSGDLTREEIARGNDRNTSADNLNRAPKSNKLPDPGITITD